MNGEKTELLLSLSILTLRAARYAPVSLLSLFMDDLIFFCLSIICFSNRFCFIRSESYESATWLGNISLEPTTFRPFDRRPHSKIQEKVKKCSLEQQYALSHVVHSLRVLLGKPRLPFLVLVVRTTNMAISSYENGIIRLM